MIPTNKTNINAQITISYKDDGVEIIIRDKDSAIQFVKIEMDPDKFVTALGGLGHVECKSCEVQGLDKIGKIREVDKPKPETEYPDCCPYCGTQKKKRRFGYECGYRGYYDPDSKNPESLGTLIDEMPCSLHKGES